MAKDNKSTGFARPSRAAKDKVLATAKEAMKFSETDDKAIQVVSPKVEEEIVVAENITPALAIVEVPKVEENENTAIESSTNQESGVGEGEKQVQLVGKKVKRKAKEARMDSMRDGRFYIALDPDYKELVKLVATRKKMTIGEFIERLIDGDSEAKKVKQALMLLNS
jgi:xanthine/CO dehydrogenase XdhC/CoxF family maturation factor